MSYYQKYLAASRDLGLKEEEAKALLNIGNLYGQTDNLDSALIYCKQSLDMADRNDFPIVTASALNSLAILYKRKKDYPASIGAFEKSIAVSRRMGNRFNEATALNGIAQVYVLMQDYPKAGQYANEGLTVAKKIDALKWEADSWSTLADVYNGRHEEGKISIRISREGEMIKYAVEDNGIGRAKAASQSPTPGKKSFGIKITGERIAIINQTRNAGASIRLSDLEEGTRVEVLLPLALYF
jgi:tetratricopeptide (TPR) repeat protein